jgi:hypothetical protein
MTYRIVPAALALALLVGCASNPNKARDIDTKLDKEEKLGADEKIGVKDGNLVVQKKVEMNEELRRLQNEVYELEDHVYGNRKYGSQGLYGSLKACRLKLTSKEYGGDGKLMWTEPMDRVSDKEDEWSVGIDEKEKIVGVSEEFLKDRMKRFDGYKNTLIKRQDEYEDKLQICDAALAARVHDMKNKKPETDAAPEATDAEQAESNE